VAAGWSIKRQTPASVCEDDPAFDSRWGLYPNLPSLLPDLGKQGGLFYVSEH
jgi:hypothetical protein